MGKWPVSLSPPYNVLYLFCHRGAEHLPQRLIVLSNNVTHRRTNGQPSYEEILPWNVGRSPGSSCQHFCISLIKLLHEWGLDLETAGSSGRCPLTTFTIICKMLFSSVKTKAHKIKIFQQKEWFLLSKSISSVLGWSFGFMHFFSLDSECFPFSTGKMKVVLFSHMSMQ